MTLSYQRHVVPGLQDGESSTKNFSSLVAFSGGVGGEGHRAQSNDVRVPGEDGEQSRDKVQSDADRTSLRSSNSRSTDPLSHGLLLEASRMKSWRFPSSSLTRAEEGTQPRCTDGVTTRYRKSSSSTLWICSHLLFQRRKETN